MTYKEAIQRFSPLTIDEIIKTSKEFVPDEFKARPWTVPGLFHGKASLSSEEQLCCYMAAYGEMHKGKMQKILQDFPFSNIDDNFEIIDWGAGQGLGTMCLLESLRMYIPDGKLQKVTLIEPSTAAIERARLHVECAVSDDVYVETLNYFLPKAPSDVLTGIHIEEPICIHVFSNILDLAVIDLKELAYLISSSGYRHYFLCVGPMNFGNSRIDSFSRYFVVDPSAVFSNVRIPEYKQISTGKWYGCVTKGFQMVRKEGKPFLVPLSYYPPKQFHAAYRLDAIQQMEDNRSAAQWPLDSSFEVLAPFDIGASVYDDIDPILAVLSNIITRGLPTKCSPFIENELNKVYNFSDKQIIYGGIKYGVADTDKLIDNYDVLKKTPVCVARIEKIVIEAVLTGHISMEQATWQVLVKENDVPCAALAFAELKMMFNHLVAMTCDYESRIFPEVSLEIISPNYTDSPLHLGNRVYSRSKSVNKEQTFDMVIDISMNETTDAENVQFSEFKANNDCYFNVRSSELVYTSRDIYTTDAITYKPLTAINPSGGHIINEENTNHLRFFLQMLFRKEDFRPGQLPILNRAMQKKGVIGLLPTGGGKSLTYQLAAMLQPGVTVIIDPLKSLMQDQYDGLMSVGIDCCTYINSELDPRQKAENETRMETSQVIFTFMSPERLCIYEFRERLQNMANVNVYFSYGVIDEVHCVSEWGQDFRFSYLHLGRNLYSFLHGKRNEHISLFGLTATASFDVLSDVERELTGNDAFTLDPEAIVRYENSNRLELQYRIEKVEIQYREDKGYWPHGPVANYPRPVDVGDNWGARDAKANFITDYIKRIPSYIRELETDESLRYIAKKFNEREGVEHIDSSDLKVDMPDNFYTKKDEYLQAGIIFCPHVNNTGVSVNVIGNKIGSFCDVGTFSGSNGDAGQQNNDSMKNMKLFRDNQIPIMVATKAFGMGIDKPNVRFTVNMNYSSSLESFVQEAGRAGRDRKMALSIILFSTYKFARIKNNSGVREYPVLEIEGKWFKEYDLRRIITDFKMNVPDSAIEFCDPLSDLMRFKCNTNDVVEEEDEEGNIQAKHKKWHCQDCSKRDTCQLREVDRNHRYRWMTPKEMNDYLSYNHIRVPKENIEYQGADYNTVMYFFDKNFKGEYTEKLKMFELLSQKELYYFYGNDKKDKPLERHPAKGFLDVVLNSKPGTEVVSIIEYENSTYADLAKAIYRMCIIGLIDDFTQEYRDNNCGAFRILSTRKKNGQYYQRLKQFLMRYYSEERSENEVEKASMRKGQNEIHKCLGYLTEFIYDKVVMKRKRAIDDMRRFCLIGVDDSKDWKEINEDLKDEIYFYFNSKYAREGYKTDNGEDFSLLDDTDRGKIGTFNVLMKYLRVIDNDVMGVSGSTKDSIRHLLGAVRLIRRGTTDINPALDLLNVFCLLVLKYGSNRNMMDELQRSYEEGYRAFREQTKDMRDFFHGIQDFKNGMKKRNVVSDEDLKMLEEIELSTELAINSDWLDNFVKLYNN